MDLDFVTSQPKAFSALELLGWIKQSQVRSSWGRQPPLTLPPLQRNGVWRPGQVFDLWRSVLDGMPIGLFYVQPAGSYVVDPESRTELTRAPEKAFDLFDGQQRMRALALGAGDPFGEGRCIWVRFKEDAFELVLSSQAQPAGYGPDGTKLPLRQRRGWAQAYEEGPGGRLQAAGLPGSAGGSLALAYPSGSSSKDTARLADLLAPLLADASGQPVHGSALPEEAAGAAGRWQQAIRNLYYRCAVFMLLPVEVRDSPTRSLEFFRRVGAGGTPLSQAEQVYAAYKTRRPEVRRVVERIHGTVSAVLTPAQIIQAAIRMAHTQAYPHTGWAPGFGTSIKALSAKAPDQGEEERWVAKLGRLLAEDGGQVPLEDAFGVARRLLSRAPGAGAFYLPEIAMAQLPPELWQVLAFWSAQGGEDIEASRAEAVRFALFWRLAVTGDEPAAQVCFRHLAGCAPPAFPGRTLYEEMVAAGRAHRIAEPDALDRFFCPEAREHPHWLSHEERFPAKAEHSGLASTWWFGTRMLPWLQREYLDREFPGYRPLSDHEDDLPYDQDHICPQDHWAADGRTFSYESRGFADRQDWEGRMGQPWMVGNAIGNMRLVDYRRNRGDGAMRILHKMPFLRQGASVGAPDPARDFLVDYPGSSALWQAVDTGDSPHFWSQARLDAFQDAVQHRTASLYREFYDKLGFAEWPSVR